MKRRRQGEGGREMRNKIAKDGKQGDRKTNVTWRDNNRQKT